MAGTTTNYGFAYPTSSDLVRDGATAIQTLAQNIDDFIAGSEGTNKLFDLIADSSYTTTGTVASTTPANLTNIHTITPNPSSGKSGLVVVICRIRAALTGTAAATNTGYVALDISGGISESASVTKAMSVTSSTAGNVMTNTSVYVYDMATPLTATTYKIQGWATTATNCTLNVYESRITVLALG